MFYRLNQKILYFLLVVQPLFLSASLFVILSLISVILSLISVILPLISVILRDECPEESLLRCFAPAQHDRKRHHHSAPYLPAVL